MKKHLFGATCASITPMLQDGSVDYESVEKLLVYLVENGIHCLYPNGTNGESLSLTAEERFRIAELAVQAGKEKSVVYIQCGAATVEESYRHVEHTRKIGADGAGLMTPVFFPTDYAALQQYYKKALTLAKDLPVYVYNIPSRTGNDMPVKLFGELTNRFSNLLGMKYSSPDLMRLQEFLEAGTRKQDVLIGNDNLALPCLVLGGNGYVSGPCAVKPKLYTKLYSAFVDGNLQEAMQAQHDIRVFLNSIAGIPEIPAIKYMLSRKGIIRECVCRAPLRALTDEEKKILDDNL